MALPSASVQFVASSGPLMRMRIYSRTIGLTFKSTGLGLSGGAATPFPRRQLSLLVCHWVIHHVWVCVS